MQMKEMLRQFVSLLTAEKVQGVRFGLKVENSAHFEPSFSEKVSFRHFLDNTTIVKKKNVEEDVFKLFIGKLLLV